MKATTFGLLDAGGNIEFKCSNQDEFFYASPSSHCGSYYRCYQNQRIKFDCSLGSVFDFYKQKCTRSAGVCYEPVCSGRIDGVYQDTTHACRRSYSCRGGNIVSIDNCPHGHLHNGESCQPQEFVVCDLPETTAVAYPYGGDRRCVDLENGNHGIQDKECRKYINCENREVVDETQCPYGLRFNSNSRDCSIAGDVPCIGSNVDLLCHRLSDGLHLDPYSDDCNSYIECSQSKLISKHDCGTQAVFNGESCVPTPLYECPKQNRLPSQDICKRRSDGLWIDPRRSCSNYVKCNNGRTIQNLECPIGQYFDPDHRLCIHEKFDDSRKCQPSKFSSECSKMEIGFYQDKSIRSSCREYFFCYNGNRTNFKCPAGKLFNGEQCVDENNYICPNSDPNTCDLKPDGYYKDKSGGCRAYYYCAAGKKFTYLCAEGQIFDGTKCAEKKSGQQCGKDCVGKPDGYYHDITSGCRNYFYCLRGEKATSLTCRGSKLFNGDSCVNSDDYVCPLPGEGSSLLQQLVASSISTQQNCLPRKCHKECKKDGFYSDIDSRCTYYYFCIGGKKTVLNCSEGYVFNGEVCVQIDFYPCPRFCGSTIKCQHGFSASFL